MYNINSFSVDPDSFIDGVPFFKASSVFYYYTLGVARPPTSVECKKISDVNVCKPEKKGRGNYFSINANGIREWICHSIRFTPHEKRKFLKELSDQNLIDKNSIAYTSTKELNFFSVLQDILSELNINGLEIQRELNMCVVDAAFMDIAIEFDENMHISYNEEAEEDREKNITGQGYNIIRVNDKMSMGESIGIVLNAILNKAWKQK